MFGRNLISLVVGAAIAASVAFISAPALLFSAPVAAVDWVLPALLIAVPLAAALVWELRALFNAPASSAIGGALSVLFPAPQTGQPPASAFA